MLGKICNVEQSVVPMFLTLGFIIQRCPWKWSFCHEIAFHMDVKSYYKGQWYCESAIMLVGNIAQNKKVINSKQLLILTWCISRCRTWPTTWLNDISFSQAQWMLNMPRVVHSWRRTCPHCKTHLRWPHPHTLPYLLFVTIWDKIVLTLAILFDKTPHHAGGKYCSHQRPILYFGMIRPAYRETNGKGQPKSWKWPCG